MAESNGGGWSSDSAWQLGPSDLEIGGDAANGPQLADIGWVSLLSDGRILVTDVGVDAVNLYDPEARLGWTIARKGAGPGEVLRVHQAWVARGDTMVTWDFGNRRLQFFSPGGTYLRSVTLDPSAVSAGTFPIGPLPDGRFLAVSRIGQVATEMPPGRDSAVYVRLDAASLDVIDTLAVLPDLERYTVRFTFGGQTMAQRQMMPFGHSTNVFTTANGFVVADNASWELREYDEGGQLRRIIRRTAALAVPQPVTAADLNAYRQGFEQRMRADRSMPPELVPQLIEDSRHAPYATTMPAFGAVLQGRDGSYWVQHYDVLESAGAATFSVVDSAGRYLGEVTLPPNTNLAAATETYVLLVASTPAGDPVVRRHPLVK